MYFNVENKSYSFGIFKYSDLSPTPHMHNHIEIVYIKEGKSDTYADNKCVTAQTGDLFISFPNQIHHYHNKEKTTGYLIIFDPDFLPEFTHIFQSSVPSSPVIKNVCGNEKILAALNGMFECFNSKSKYKDEEIKGCLLIFFSEIFPLCKFESKSELSESTPAKDIINYCYENYKKDISLKNISDDLHISRCYISRVFRSKLNTGFYEYINSLRINAACALLKSTKSTITEISYEVGYNSVRTFDRCFLKYIGLSPKEYRSQIKSENAK